MEKKLWFRAKRYGWGWIPVTWEGWLAIAVYALGTLFVVRNIIALHNTGRFEGIWVVISLGRVFFLTTALVLVCYWKGEKPSWGWGDKSK